MALKLLKQSRSFGGVLKQFSHESTSTRSTMNFCVYLPPNASETQKVPVIYFLAGLTCNEELMHIKAGAHRVAAQRGVAIVTPDTSPRGVEIEGADDSWDFGSAAGFYVDATEPKWAPHYNMYTYVTKELPSLVNANFPVLADKVSIMGHSMGGHGALTLALRFVQGSFTGYLGTDQAAWKTYDATLLVLEKGANPSLKIWVDQGTDDQFLHEKQLLPEAFEAACQKVGQPLTLRMLDGYDHGYYFISTFIDEHLNNHADILYK
ncbi:hypothetical protein Ae201684P_007016 [Aphanomyces euteiches]|nr:hypothetical protein Ae201684P_007016 [Aphanomyces euteiches]